MEHFGLHPVKLTLSFQEMKAISDVLEIAILESGSCQVKVETIVLAEFYLPWTKRLMHAYVTNKTIKRKDRNYPLPLFIARLVHRRLQELPSRDAYQAVLAKLDKALVDRNMKPDFTTTI